MATTKSPALASSDLPLEEDLNQRVTERAISQFTIYRRRFLRHPAGIIGVIIFTLLLAMAIFAPLITPGVTPATPFPNAIGLAPQGPSVDNFPARIFGNTLTAIISTNKDDAIAFTNNSVLAEVTFGARVTLAIGIISAIIASYIGTLLGALSGYFGGWVETVIMRITDVALALPFLPLVIAIAIASHVETTVTSLIVIFSLVGWTNVARLVRGNFLVQTNLDYVEAARAVGANDWRIMFRHILPNTFAPVIVATVLNVAAFIVAEATLDYLFLGINLPLVTWGNIIAVSKGYVDTNWWWSFFPGLFIVITVLAINLIGEALRDALNVRGAA
jgi:peptide/nickel transport system permease protein